MLVSHADMPSKSENTYSMITPQLALTIRVPAYLMNPFVFKKHPYEYEK